MRDIFAKDEDLLCGGLLGEGSFGSVFNAWYQKKQMALKKFSGEIEIPDSVTSINNNAFGYYSYFSYINIIIKGVTINISKYNLENEYNKAFEMLETKDFSVNIYTLLKNAMIIGYYLKTGDKDAETYIMENAFEIFIWLIDEEDIPTIYALLKMGKFVTSKNIDKLFEYTNNNDKTEIKLMLMNYKHEHIGYIPPKKFEIW